MTKHAWNDNNYEGKALRRVFAKLIKRFEKIADDGELDDLIKVANSLSVISNSKANLAKYEHLDKKLDHVLQLLKQRELQQIIPEVRLDAKQLPGQSD